MSEEIKNTGAESFEELLEQSLKTLHNGEKVTGIVTKINATDVSVDLGVKQAGYIPFVELSDDPNFDVAANIKVGDEVEFGGLFGRAPIMRVSPYSAEKFIARGGRIPAPLQSLKN